MPYDDVGGEGLEDLGPFGEEAWAVALKRIEAAMKPPVGDSPH